MWHTRARIRAAALICRRWGAFPGRWRVVLRTIQDVRAHGASMSPTVVRTRHGFRLTCFLEDWIGQHVFVSGSYEENAAALVSQLIRPGSTVVDVGANIGFFTLLFSSLVGPSGKVLACEPMPVALGRLRGNLELNHIRNVTVHPVAVAPADHEATFYLGPPHHTSVSSLIPTEGATTVNVACRRLDDLVGDVPVHLMKIDVEGAEAGVLESAPMLLRRGVPHIILEVNAPDVAASLSGRGYRMYRIDWDALRRVDDPYDPSLPSQYNALFTLASALPSGIRVEGAR